MKDIWRDQHDVQQSLITSPLTSLKTPTLTKNQLDLSGAEKLVDKKYIKKKKQNATGGFMKTDNASNIMGGISNLTTGVNNAVQGYTGTQSAINSGIHKGMQALGPWGMAVSAITGAADAIGAMAGAKVDVLDSNSASRAGVGGANKASEMLSAIPGMGWITGAIAAAGGKTLEGNKSAYIDGMAPGYSKSVQDINASAAGGGKQMLFGKNKMNAFIQKQNEANDMITSIAMQSEMARNNDAAQLYQSQNFNKYSGSTPRLLMAKGGTKFQELEVARTILAKKKKDISKYQLGGKIIDPSKNIIPDGALHKNRNHLSEHNEELKDQITEKGIPVVSENSDGTITQHAEVEVGEVIFNLANTKIIEDYWQQYKETGDDSIAIECGKFLTKELLRNTVDKAGIKKSIE